MGLPLFICFLAAIGCISSGVKQQALGLALYGRQVVQAMQPCGALDGKCLRRTSVEEVATRAA